MMHFTSDHHAGHTNILHLGDGRDFKSISHMHAEIINRHNSVVGFDDDVYFLGDIAMGTLEDSLKIFSGMMGNKFLIPGNHEKIFSGTNSKTRIQTYTPVYEDAGFTVLPENTSVVIDGQEVLLSHFPYSEKLFNKTQTDKFAKNRPVDTGLPLIHGHTHQRHQHQDDRKRMFHVGMDSTNFTPVSEVEIVDWLNRLRTNKIL